MERWVQQRIGRIKPDKDTTCCLQKQNLMKFLHSGDCSTCFKRAYVKDSVPNALQTFAYLLQPPNEVGFSTIPILQEGKTRQHVA